jgi:phytoene dehydrogenase-like protein
MTTTRYFDVIVLGRSLGALSAAALLARRDFRVLVLGQGEKPNAYRFEGNVFVRRTFSMLFGATPPWKRLLHELAQTQSFRRRQASLDPMFQVLLANHRFELAPDMELFERELEREFPEVRPLVDELYGTLATTNAIVDQAFERELVWPPATLWERFETSRVASSLPYVGNQSTTDLLARFPLGHPYRSIVALTAEFSSHLATDGDGLPPLAVARLHGAWTRGLYALEGGEDELADFLVERIEAHGGTCRLDSRATSLVVRRGKVAGVMEDGEEQPIGTALVVTNLTGEQLVDLSNGEGISQAARQKWPKVTASAGRFVTSIVMRREGLPEALGKESFISANRQSRVDPRRPVVHLQRAPVPVTPTPQTQRNSISDGVNVVPSPAAPATSALPANLELISAEVLLPVRGPLTLYEARDAILATLREQLPFFEQHVVAVDSPHDGLPLFLYERGVRKEIDRVHVRETEPQGEPLTWQYTIEPRGYLGIGGEPLRGPVPGTYLVGSSVLPALGQEGELLAAFSVARLVAKMHGGHQRMRQRMWSRIETT